VRASAPTARLVGRDHLGNRSVGRYHARVCTTTSEPGPACCAGGLVAAAAVGGMRGRRPPCRHPRPTRHLARSYFEDPAAQQLRDRFVVYGDRSNYTPNSVPPEWWEANRRLPTSRPLCTPLAARRPALPTRLPASSAAPCAPARPQVRLAQPHPRLPAQPLSVQAPQLCAGAAHHQPHRCAAAGRGPASAGRPAGRVCTSWIPLGPPRSRRPPTTAPPAAPRRHAGRIPAQGRLRRAGQAQLAQVRGVGASGQPGAGGPGQGAPRPQQPLGLSTRSCCSFGSGRIETSKGGVVEPLGSWEELRGAGQAPRSGSQSRARAVGREI
jgi:hypothetical protein